MKSFNYGYNVNTSPEGFDSYGISNRWSFVPEEWRQTYAQKYAGVMPPAVYFDLRASDAHYRNKDDIITEFSREDSGSMDPNHLPLFDSQGEWPYGTSPGEGTQIRRDNVAEFVAAPNISDRTFQANYPGGSTIVFGRYLNPNGRLYASPNSATPEILSGIALQTFVAGARKTAERLTQNTFAEYDWARKGLGIAPLSNGTPPAAASGLQAPPAKPATGSPGAIKGVNKSAFASNVGRLNLQTPTVGSPTGEGLLAMASSVPVTNTFAQTQAEIDRVQQAKLDALAQAQSAPPALPSQFQPATLNVDGNWFAPQPTTIVAPLAQGLVNTLADFIAMVSGVATAYVAVPSLIVLFAQNPSLEKTFGNLSSSDRDAFRQSWNKTYPPRVKFSK
jgi:hypothetical protein